MKKHKTWAIDGRNIFADGWKPHIKWLVILKSFNRSSVRTYSKKPTSYQNYRDAVADAENAARAGVWDIIIVAEKTHNTWHN